MNDRLRTDLSASVEREEVAPPLALDSLMKLYFGGEMDAGYAMSGQVAGRITKVLPVREILTSTWRDCQERLRTLGATFSNDTAASS